MKTEIKNTKDYILLLDSIKNTAINDDWRICSFTGDLIKYSNGQHSYKISAYKKLNPQAKDLDLPLLPGFQQSKLPKGFEPELLNCLWCGGDEKSCSKTKDCDDNGKFKELHTVINPEGKEMLVGKWIY